MPAAGRVLSAIQRSVLAGSCRHSETFRQIIVLRVANVDAGLGRLSHFALGRGSPIRQSTRKIF